MIKEKVKSESIEGKFDIPADEPTYTVVKDKDGRIIDYLDVKIEGYANTFELDRGGDLSIPGCFLEHLGEYKENPILLADHERMTTHAIGRVFSAYEDDKGLKVSARLSNAPDVKNVRYKVAERILKTFSIGGLFNIIFGKDKNYIDKIELREISIVAVPMNRRSVFEVKNDKAKNQPPNDPHSEKMNAENPESDNSLYVEVESGVKKITD